VQAEQLNIGDRWNAPGFLSLATLDTMIITTTTHQCPLCRGNGMRYSAVALKRVLCCVCNASGTIIMPDVDRVIVNYHGYGVPPDRAVNEYLIDSCAVVFVRDDGWSLGSPISFYDVAYRIYANEWEWMIRSPFTFAEPIALLTQPIDDEKPL
jgi:hypothetical protein